MKQVLINELDKPLIDVPKLNSFIENGKPYKLFGFIDWGVESIGLFEIYKGQNIFHYLSHKGVLSMVLPTFFGSKSQDILSREKSSFSKLNECINSVNLSGLTPAHIAVIHNPTALQTLSQVGAILTSEGYTAILQKNGGRAVAFSPLEYIFRDEPTAHNFFTQSIRAGCVDIFALFNKEHHVVQVQFLRYLPYVVQEINKVNTANSSNVFSVIFEDYWSDILTVDHSSFIKVMRLINILNDQNKDWNLSIEDWSHLLSVENFENFSQIRQCILHKCALKFLDGTLSAMQLEDFIKVDAIEDGKFQQLKYYFVEGSLNPLGFVEVSAVGLIVDGDISTNPVKHGVPLIALDSAVVLSSVNSGARHSVDHSAEEHKARELGSVESQKISVIPTPSLSLLSEPVDRPSIKPKAVTKVVSIHDYAEGVTSCLQGSEKCTEHLTYDLGINYTQLHSFISMLALSVDYFGKVLDVAAKQLGVVTKNTRDFLSEYIGELEAHDLLTTDNRRKLSAYGLACARDQVDLAKLLLNKGFELGVYSGSTNSIFEIPIKYNSISIIEYLLNEQDSIIIDWHYILSQAIKYANIKAVECYINSGSDIIQGITDRGGLSTEHGKYNILNKALDGLTELSELRRFQGDQVKEEAALRKIPKLCECIKMMIESGKVYYAEENLTVSKKTFALLKELKSAIKILSDDPSMSKIVEAISLVKGLIISHYESCDLSLMAQQLLGRIKSDVDYDTASNATFITHFSALSDLGRNGQFDDEYKESVLQSAAVMTSSVSQVKPLLPVSVVDTSLVENHLPPVLGESSDDI